MEHHHPNAGLLAKAIRARREELGLNQDELRNAGAPGPSPVTAGKYEAGQIPVRLQEDTLAKFDRALRWRAGSAARVLSDGQAPVEDEEAMDNAALAEWDAITQDREMLKEVQSGLDELLPKIIEIRTQLERLAVDPELRNRSASLHADMAMQLLGIQRYLDERKD